MSDFEARMAALRAGYVARAPSEIEVLQTAASARDRAALTARAHSLAGTSAVFGFPLVGEMARALESALDGGADEAAWQPLLAPLLEALGAINAGARPA